MEGRDQLTVIPGERIEESIPAAFNQDTPTVPYGDRPAD